jgi:hypothetical protein
MSRGLTEYKNGRISDLIGWIEGFYERNKRVSASSNSNNEPRENYQVAINGAQIDGTLEL